MEVVLLERIEKLGQMGDVVKVKPGFARNYLLPRAKALRANKANLAYFEGQKAQLEAANLKRRDEAQAVADKMEGLTLIIVRQAGESGQLYGSVSARDIATAIGEEGFTLERGQVQLDQPIKALGALDVTVVLHPEVKVTVQVSVARSEEEAKLQTEDAAELLENPEDLVTEDEDAALEDAMGDASEEDLLAAVEETTAEEVSEEASEEASEEVKED